MTSILLNYHAVFYVNHVVFVENSMIDSVFS